MNAPTEIRVRLFAQARELCGESEARLPADDVPNAGALRAALVRRYPHIASLAARSAVAVNLEYARDDRPIHPGDDVALIPPVAGG